MAWGQLAAALAGLLLLWVLAAAYVTRSRWLRRLRLWRRPYRTRYPIVLVHGLLGFDEVRVKGETHEYFRGVEARLTARGNEVYRPRLPPIASVARRAEALKRFVESLGPRPVIVVAHSMGGLDARYAIARLGLARRIKALITVGTPHRGTPIADVGTSLASRVGLRALVKSLGLDFDAFEDLTSARMEHFNREIEDNSAVMYLSVVGKGRAVHPLLRPTHEYLRRAAGDNDGLVPARSQAWGEVLFEVEIDHWGQVGWSGAGDVSMYDSIVRELSARGL